MIRVRCVREYRIIGTTGTNGLVDCASKPRVRQSLTLGFMPPPPLGALFPYVLFVVFDFVLIEQRYQFIPIRFGPMVFFLTFNVFAHGKCTVTRLPDERRQIGKCAMNPTRRIRFDRANHGRDCFVLP